ncbi:MAG TPA: PQQ-binding-like beta-propeller repeat protein, partial [Blastocatellia bacterium]|nr:PQQ-binding-like beta-propeller repeat protein [Blastocatellia bacterium]
MNIIYLGIKGTVVALNRATGEELWRTTLKGSDFVNVVLDGNQLYATTKGEIFCLDTATGQPRWHNKLTGMGTGLIVIATPTGSQVLSAQEKRQRDQAAVTAAT